MKVPEITEAHSGSAAVILSTILTMSCQLAAAQPSLSKAVCDDKGTPSSPRAAVEDWMSKTLGQKISWESTLSFSQIDQVDLAALDRMGTSAARAMPLSPIDPAMHTMHAAVSYAHFLSGRYDMALSSAEKALRDNPDFLLAICMFEAGLAFIAHEFDDAIAFVDRGLAINPNLAQAWNLGAWVRAFGGEPDLALDYAARAMRSILIDRARHRMRSKRGGGAQRVELPEQELVADDECLELLAMDQALTALGTTHPRLVQVVELRFFAGLSVEDAAKALDVDTRTIERDWRKARALIHDAMGAST